MLTPSQTIGPFFSHALTWPDGAHVVPEGIRDACWLRGRVYDGAGEPVPDALVESWQADPDGRFDNPAFRGLARCPSDENGRWAIRTVKPGAPGGGQAPHLVLSVFARGLLNRVVTRVYFGDEPEANAADQVLARVAEARRDTLLAQVAADGYTFDIRLQGDNETVFFDI